MIGLPMFSTPERSGSKTRRITMQKFFVAPATIILAAQILSAASVYDYQLNSIDFEVVPLRDFKGKVLLIVNVASRCGYTPQYAGLESLYRRYKDRGFVILGIPSNDFGQQE